IPAPNFRPGQRTKICSEVVERHEIVRQAQGTSAISAGFPAISLLVSTSGKLRSSAVPVQTLPGSVVRRKTRLGKLRGDRRHRKLPGCIQNWYATAGQSARRMSALVGPI